MLGTRYRLNPREHIPYTVWMLPRRAHIVRETKQFDVWCPDDSRGDLGAGALENMMLLGGSISDIVDKKQLRISRRFDGYDIDDAITAVTLYFAGPWNGSRKYALRRVIHVARMFATKVIGHWLVEDMY